MVASQPPRRILMLLENASFLYDLRPRREARTLLEAGYHVTVICPCTHGRTHPKQVEGARVYCYPAPTHRGGILGYLVEYGYSLVMMLLFTLWVWIREGVDIIHAHNPPDILCLVAALLKPFGKRFIFDHHDLAPELYLTRFGRESGDLFYRMLIRFERWSCRLADRVLATNQSYKEIVVKRHGIPASKVFIVRNGPDQMTHLVEPDPTLRRRAPIIIAYVGAMGPQDGVDYLLRALHHLVVDLHRSDFLCVLMGGGPTLESLQALSRELKLEEHVWFTGWISDRTRLLRYLSTADICVQPDPATPLNEVSTMIKTMEYMALGKPVVAFDLLETRRTGGDALLYAPPNDEYAFARQIVRLMDDPELRRRLGEQGQKRVLTHFTWRHAAANLLQAYASLEGERG
ncbi:MAG: glycosyltransferase WbuB [Chloroflexi bacterium]|nr:MAG: glycosyltransferase WbuB [Chloroflexota bacterium]